MQWWAFWDIRVFPGAGPGIPSMQTFSTATQQGWVEDGWFFIITYPVVSAGDFLIKTH